MRVILSCVAIIIIVVLGIKINETRIQQQKEFKEYHDKVVQYCMERDYLTYSIDTRKKIYRFCLSSDGVLHLPNLMDDE